MVAEWKAAEYPIISNAIFNAKRTNEIMKPHIAVTGN